jgi:hypothetical protein
MRTSQGVARFSRESGHSTTRRCDDIDDPSTEGRRVIGASSIQADPFRRNLQRQPLRLPAKGRRVVASLSCRIPVGRDRRVRRTKRNPSELLVAFAAGSSVVLGRAGRSAIGPYRFDGPQPGRARPPGAPHEEIGAKTNFVPKFIIQILAQNRFKICFVPKSLTCGDVFARIARPLKRRFHVSRS